MTNTQIQSEFRPVLMTWMMKPTWMAIERIKGII
jgi:hypothetical protein